MSLKEVCRACLCTGRTMSSLQESIVPKFESPPDSVIDLWKIFTKTLITHDHSFPDKICMECLDEIQQMYFFMLKCDRSDDTLKKIGNAKIRLKKLSNVPELLHPDILQRKTEITEWNDRKNAGDQFDENWEQFTVYVYSNDQVNPQLQDIVMIQPERNDFTNQGHLGCKNDAREDEVSCIQDIKQEPDLDLGMDEDQFNEIEQGDTSGTEIIYPECCFQCQTTESLAKHLIEKHMEGKMCKLCNKEFKCSATRHCCTHFEKIQELPYSTDTKSRKCSVCSNVFKLKSDLSKQLSIHTGTGLIKCETCSKAENCRNLTDDSSDHAKEHPFKCEICQKTYRTQKYLRFHLISHGQKIFGCNICPSTFKRNISLTEHLQLHSKERPFKCELCPSEFQIKHHLTEHIKWHTGGNLFKCGNCQKAFHYKSNLMEHLRSHINSERPFKCEICPKSFKRKSTLKSHLLSHTGERSFKCENCPKTFMLKSSLKQHFKLHTGERPFKCEYCLKYFLRKDTLVIHLRGHTGEKPFKCEICPKAYIEKRCLKYHMKRHATV